MKELSSQARRVLELAQDGDEPDVGAEARVERSLGRRLATGALVAGGGAAMTKTAAGAGLLGAAVKSMVVAGSAATLVLTGWHATQPSSSVSEVETVASGGPADVAHATTPLAMSPPESSATEAEVPAPTALKRARPSSVESERTWQAPRLKAHASNTASLPAGDDVRSGAPRAVSKVVPTRAEQDPLLAETQALRRAQGALRRGDTQTALQLLKEQDRKHASGVLAQERSAARILALCQAGQVAQARAHAHEFQVRFPRSPLLGKVRDACW